MSGEQPKEKYKGEEQSLPTSEGEEESWKPDWDRDLFQPMAITTMLTGLIVALVELAKIIYPSSPIFPGYYLFVIFLVIESVFYTRYTYAHRRESSAPYRIRELILILLFLRILTYFFSGSPGISLEEIILSLKSAKALFPLPYIINSLLFLLPWWLSNLYMEDILSLQLTPDRYAPPANSPEFKRWLAANVKFIPATRLLRAITSRFFSMGVLLILAMIVTWQVRLKVTGMPPGYRYALIGGSLYYIAGLTLVSRAHYLRRKIDWHREEITFSEEMSSSWIVTSLGAILVIFVIILLLPTNFSPLSWDRFIAGVIWLISLIASLFAGKGFAPDMETMRELSKKLGGMPRGPDFSPPPSGQPISFPWWETVKWALMLAAILMAIAYALYPMFKSRGFKKTLLGRIFMIIGRYVVLIWRAISRLLERIAELFISIKEAQREKRAAKEGAAGGRYTPSARVGKSKQLSAEAIFITEIYLTLIKLSTMLGCPRIRSRTPNEYSEDFKDAFPEYKDEIAPLTEGFVETRYGEHELEKEEVNKLRRYWRLIKRDFEGRIKGGEMRR